ncbi:hypothetical protein SAMN04488510_11033 [Fervidobacterium changbaicum]|uniref:Uncharacterized protein n=1 Tax=Fervidobacterium changbaicum TaxID=310769 RepID=A0ABX5QTA2_9BACT|nr:glycosyltransferase [Fervidobacterium changbaicum]QAV33756.1 hypothetical protein CBS1_08515 [Fervidobacterium changbaicum]SDH32110.1 hypothetical protein SAMN04488510_11033 [Fervidobacterium changbaicum]
MKITFITPQPPERFGGGSIVILSHLIALRGLVGSSSIKYIGPKSNTIDLRDFVSEYIYVPSSSMVLKFISVLKQDSFLSVDKFILSNIKDLKGFLRDSDIIWIETTKLGNSLRILRDYIGKAKVILSVHNIEQLYYKQSEKITGMLLKKAISHSEKFCAEFSDLMLFPTEEIYKLYEKITETRIRNVAIVNFFLNDDQVHVTDDILRGACITGSYRYGHNRQPLDTLISEWSKKSHSFKLFVFGSNIPVKTMKKSSNCKDIVFVINPVDDTDILPKIPIALNPVISSGGVLVKNIVALKNGQVVTGFPGSFRGTRVGKYFEVVTSLEDMLERVEALLDDRKTLKEKREAAAEYYITQHSLSYGLEAFQQIIDKIVW